MTLCDTIAKMIPNELGITIDKALVDESGASEACMNLTSQVKKLIDMSRTI